MKGVYKDLKRFWEGFLIEAGLLFFMAIIDYAARDEKAQEIRKQIDHLADAVLIVGSVAYNPNAVTDDSDLDLVARVEFSKENLAEIYFQIGLKSEYDEQVGELAKDKVFNTMSINFKGIVHMQSFDIGLHLWSPEAWDNVVNLKPNKIFKKSDFDPRIMYSLRVALRAGSRWLRDSGWRMNLGIK